MTSRKSHLFPEECISTCDLSCLSIQVKSLTMDHSTQLHFPKDSLSTQAQQNTNLQMQRVRFSIPYYDNTTLSYPISTWEYPIAILGTVTSGLGFQRTLGLSNKKKSECLGEFPSNQGLGNPLNLE